MADPWLAEAERRKNLIRSAYYNYLGYNPDEAGLQYWLAQSQGLNNDSKLVDAIAFSGGAERQPGLSAQVLSDPEYASWFRQMGIEESQAQSALAANRDAALRRMNTQVSMYDQQREQSRRNVNDDAEARGMFQSGGRLQKLNETDTEYDRQRAQYTEGVAEGIAQDERQAAQQLADLRRQNAERILATRTKLTQNTLGAPING